MSHINIWFHLSANTLWAELKDDDDLPLDGADVTAKLVDAVLGTDVPEPGAPWPVTLVQDGPGLYRWDAPDELQVEPERFYKAQVTAVAAGTGAEQYAEAVIKVEVNPGTPA